MMTAPPTWPRWIAVLLTVALGIGAAYRLCTRSKLPRGVPVILTF